MEEVQFDLLKFFFFFFFFKRQKDFSDNGYIYSDDDTKVSFYRKGMMHKKGKIQKIAKQNDSLGLEPDLSMDEVQWVVRQVEVPSWGMES